MTHAAQTLADGVQLLGGEGTLAHARGVGLHDAEDGAHAVRTHAQTRHDAADRRRGGGHVRVRTQVDVQHRRVRSLHQHLLALVQRLVDLVHRVDDHRQQLRKQRLDLRQLALVVVVLQVVADAVLRDDNQASLTML